MKKFHIVLTLLAVFCSVAAFAQEPKLPRKVKNVNLLNLDGNTASLPNFGRKNLLIFYVDPDKPKQNDAFTVEMEENHKAEGDNLYGFGILNLADAPLVPNRVARVLAKKRTEKNGATVLADQSHTLRDAWGLGDCNNMFVLLVVSKEGELVYCKKGELSRKDIDEFYTFIQDYR